MQGAAKYAVRVQLDPDALVAKKIGINPADQRRMMNESLDVMVDLAREGMTMMVVTHEMGFARKVAHRVIFMDKGEIVEDAPKEDFFGKPRSERAQQFLSKILQH